MIIPPSKTDNILEIADMDRMVIIIKKNILNFYMLTFANYKEFVEVYDATSLTDDIILFWMKQYCFNVGGGSYGIYSSDYEILTGRIYKEYCQIMMNKLVDTGHLSLLWNKKKKIVYWKKNRV